MQIAQPKLADRLFSKFIILLIPVFALTVQVLLMGLTNHLVSLEKSQMAARVGSLVGRTAAVISSEDVKADLVLTEAYMGMLLTDKAILCAEIREPSGKLIASAPPRIGCKGQENNPQIAIPMLGQTEENFTIRTSDAEIVASRQQKQFFAVLALILGLAIAFLASWFGFRKFVTKPLNDILSAITTAKVSGQASPIIYSAKDELSIVANAFNELQHKLALEAQRNAETLARINYIYNETPALMVSVNSKGKILNVSGHWLEVTGYHRSEVVGENLARFVYGKAPQEFLNSILENDEKPVIKDEPFELVDKNGYAIDVEVSASGQMLDGEFCYLCVMSDVRELKVTQKNLKAQAVTDFLTRLPNRQGLFDYLEELDQTSEKEKQSTAFLFVDLDGFKAVNDIHGHEAGDDLLKIASMRLRHSVKSTDFLARLGGDEFVIVLRELADEADVSVIAERILTNFLAPFEVAGQKVRVGTSIGISKFDAQNRTSEKALRMADLAMYTSKNAGKNRYAIYPRNLENETHSLHLQSENMLLQ